MKKVAFLSLFLLVISSSCFYSCKRTISPEKTIAQTLLAQIDTFIQLKNKMIAAAGSATANEKQLQQLFLQTRLAYKKFEWAAEYFTPATARFVNGPPVQEVEMLSGQVFEPAGLQVIEGYLFPKYNPAKKQLLLNQLRLLQAGCDKFKVYYANIDIFDWQVFDASKLEIFRMLSLNISGFDNPLTLNSMSESAASIKSLKAVLACYGNNTDDGLPATMDAAAKYLLSNTNFNSFNRATFITKYGNPISTGITDIEKKLGIHVIRYNRLLNQDAKTLFDKDAFNPNAYAPNPESFSSPQKVALGQVLFADPILSGDSGRSCQSCHQPEKGFADGLVKNTRLGTNKLLPRNTPTLLNAALQPSQFYDLRVATLENQALAVVQNKDEMHGSMKAAAARLWKSQKYRSLFSSAFPNKNRKEIDTLEVMNAIGSYIRSLAVLNSRFDEYMRGNENVMSPEEIAGFNLFMGKAKCGTCHYMPLFNGSFPPRYMLVESEVIGVPKSLAKNVIDDDMGRYYVLKTRAFKHAFKISTVRNASHTAPYMHNGVFTTLQQVMDFYNEGGGAGLGYPVENQTLAADKLHLTQKESNEVIAFIKSLDSK